ncbi:MAG: Adenine phosphoribosyltransferase (EC [uncultured Campylobacterales bacterium]|uniref:Adenine phosphoribosyltransferase n=1 Tax=uncultured Campylobacterales bacterium TaxID=352960 RepID=A0A6S6T890_9BACT|nr:MAG: Adenine phosphoribosyltransferase (EC [uncultured Campylobacterales bacterium]
MQYLLSKLKDVPNFPKPGITFKDITPLLSDKKAFKQAIEIFYEEYKDKNIDYIIGIESRGFILGAALALQLNVGFVPIRKVGKLPAEKISCKYELEYGYDELEMHKHSFEIQNPNVVLIDDLIATGGSANASISLINKLGVNELYTAFLVNLTFLKGTDKLNTNKIFTILDI